MITTGLVLLALALVTGLWVGFRSISNLQRGAKGMFTTTTTSRPSGFVQQARSFDRMFDNHFTNMKLMVLPALLGIAGAIVLVIGLVQKYLP